VAMGSWGRGRVVFFAVGGFARHEPCVFRFGFFLECFSMLLSLMGAAIVGVFLDGATVDGCHCYWSVLGGAAVDGRDNNI